MALHEEKALPSYRKPLPVPSFRCSLCLIIDEASSHVSSHPALKSSERSRLSATSVCKKLPRTVLPTRLPYLPEVSRILSLFAQVSCCITDPPDTLNDSRLVLLVQRCTYKTRKSRTDSSLSLEIEAGRRHDEHQQRNESISIHHIKPQLSVSTMVRIGNPNALQRHTGLTCIHEEFSSLACYTQKVMGF